MRDPARPLRTHEVANQPPRLVGHNAYEADPALKEAVVRDGAGWAADRLGAFGRAVGSGRMQELAFAANRFPPVLRAFDRFGVRVDEVEFHPAYHELMRFAIEAGVHSVAWTAPAGGHVAHAAFEYLLTQAEPGVCCPVTMTHAAVPLLRRHAEIGADWAPRATACAYDPRPVPAAEKAGVTLGMAMTEKQGGSDVRANTTRARPLGNRGPGGAYALTGHKWFCSAPMSDAFFTLAQAEGGLSCFLVPRWRTDGTRNPFLIQRLKDKLGNRANATAEVEYDDARAILVGEEGRGVAVIMEMVQETRLDAATAPAGMMRQALVEAVHHARHRMAFGRRLADQPLMRGVLADLAVESEAAAALVFRVARAFDEAGESDEARLFARLGVAVAKYWVNRRLPHFAYEAMECLGGGGYIEESVMPRLYREAPVNSIWEGSGNVICLDVLRTIGRDPESVAAFLAEAEAARGGDARLDAALGRLKDMLSPGAVEEADARRLTEAMAVVLQASLLVRHAPQAVADAFCASRLDPGRCWAYGGLPAGLRLDAILERATAADGRGARPEHAR